jgi:uncharacterized membrane protein
MAVKKEQAKLKAVERSNDQSKGRSKSQPLSPDWLTSQNVEAISKLEEAAREQRTPTDRIADVIAKFCGSMTFVWVHVIWFGAWISYNLLPGVKHIDPFPFTFLTLVVSLEAIFLSTFILISQNHDTRISERRNHLDLQINLLTEQENTMIITMLRAIAEKVGVDLSHDQRVEVMSEEVQPDRLVQQIEQHEEEK